MNPTLILCELGETGLEGQESFSPFCLKAHRALRAAGLPYERRHGRSPDAFREWNPAGQVPVLLVDGAPIADSTRILARIETLGGRSLLARDPRERAEQLLWEELADTALNGFLVASRWADERNWPLVRAAYFAGMPAVVRAFVPAMVRRRVMESLVARDVWRLGAESCWERFSLLLDQLETRAPREGFWTGDCLSVADIAIFAQLHALRTPLTAPQRSAVAERTVLSAWLDRTDRATRSASDDGGDRLGERRDVARRDRAERDAEARLERNDERVALS